MKCNQINSFYSKNNVLMLSFFERENDLLLYIEVYFILY